MECWQLSSGMEDPYFTGKAQLRRTLEISSGMQKQTLECGRHSLLSSAISKWWKSTMWFHVFHQVCCPTTIYSTSNDSRQRRRDRGTRIRRGRGKWGRVVPSFKFSKHIFLNSSSNFWGNFMMRTTISPSSYKNYLKTQKSSRPRSLFSNMRRVPSIYNSTC